MDYVVYKNDLMARQMGDKYFHEMDGDGEYLGVFKTLDEAKSFVDGYDLPEPEIVRTKRGLDTVLYSELVAYEDDDASEEAYCRTAMTDGLMAAMMLHQWHYWKFLDHEEDYYPTLQDCLKD